MKYKVTVTRTSYASREHVIEADSEEEATQKALDEAGDYEYSEKDAEYEVQYVEKIDNKLKE